MKLTLTEDLVSEKALLRSLEGQVSKRALKRLFDQKRVFMNNETLSAKKILKSGTHTIGIQILRTSFPTIEVLFEDNDLLIINKPKNLPCLPNDPFDQASCIHFIRENFNHPYFQDDENESGLVHRLDVETTGVLIFAKDQDTQVSLRDFLKTDQVQKMYRAWTPAHDLPPLPLEITWEMAHHNHLKGKMVVLTDAKVTKYRGYPQEAVTWIQEKVDEQNDFMDLRIQILTGVRHQIRAHLKALDCPIVGDTKYGTPHPLGLALHAESIRIEWKGKIIEAIAPLPVLWKNYSN